MVAIFSLIAGAIIIIGCFLTIIRDVIPSKWFPIIAITLGLILGLDFLFAGMFPSWIKGMLWRCYRYRAVIPFHHYLQRMRHLQQYCWSETRSIYVAISYWDENFWVGNKRDADWLCCQCWQVNMLITKVCGVSRGRGWSPCFLLNVFPHLAPPACNYRDHRSQKIYSMLLL